MSDETKPNMAYLPQVEANKVADVRSLLDQEMQGCTFTWDDLLKALQCFLDNHPEIAPLKFNPTTLAQYMQTRNWLQLNASPDGLPPRFSVAIASVYGLDMFDWNYTQISPTSPT